MTFSEAIKTRAAADYADFLIPHLERTTELLDAGCGQGTISIGLAEYCASVTAIDVANHFEGAVAYATRHEISNVQFECGDVYAINYPDGVFDACICHSVLEALERPLEALGELFRICKAGAVVGVASVDYGGVIIAGDDAPQLERFYQVREQLWAEQSLANPRMGRNLRGLLNQAGFMDVEATTKHFCYGTTTAIRQFGEARAAECDDPWYAESALAGGHLTGDELRRIKRAWESWSQSPSAYLAFPWCRAVGWKP